jgi:ADP-ribosyl-[dinitrogen reductase] hydrolase
MHFLLVGEQFRKAIEKTITIRGDTDTNACIVGALLGAYHGLTGMAMSEQIEKIYQFKGKVYKRPEWLIPSKAMPELLARLSDIAPKELKMIGA